MPNSVNSPMITVIGLGFVGEPLLRSIHNAGFNVSGVDISIPKIEKLSNDSSLSGVTFSDSLKDFSKSDVFIIALPTPVDDDGIPDLSIILNTASAIGDFISPDQMVIIESTYAPKTTRDEILPRLTKNLGGQELHLVYSPERINPGDDKWHVDNTPKLVAAEPKVAQERINSIYSKVFSQLIFVESFEIAETAKLLENIYRFVNINFINEFQQNCEAMGIDASKVIEAASSKPFGFQKFLPSLGIGGHCIPVAPLHFSDRLKKDGIENGFIKHGVEINHLHSSKVISKLENFLGKLSNLTFLVVGVTYKPGVPDIRHSSALNFIEQLRALGCQVYWHDPLVPLINDEKSSPLSTPSDIALICVDQPSTLVNELVASQKKVIDISRGLDIRQLK